MESNHLPVAYQATARPESLAAMGPMPRIELGSVAYHATALPLSYRGVDLAMGVEPTQRRYECRMLPSTSRQNGAVCWNRTSFTDLQDRRIASNAYTAWSERRESNPLAETGNLVPNQWATPANLEREMGIEPTSGVWKTPALPLDDTRLKLAFCCQRANCHQNGLGGWI